MEIPDQTSALQLAVHAAKEAGNILLQAKDIVVNSSIDKDIKLQADVVSEKLIVDILKKGSDFGILSEEAGMLAEGSSPYRWIVDPLDGSLNYSRGIEMYAVSIGLWKESTPVLGVVYDFLHDRLYTGIVNGEAKCNDEVIKVSAVTEKKGSILATGFPVYTSFDTSTLNEFVAGIQEYKKVRLFGSAAMSLIHVAKGSIEAYRENNIAIWDVAAGLAVVLAAGGKISVLPGKGAHYLNVSADNGLI